MQRLGAGQFLAVDGEAQRRLGLVEQALPRGGAGDRFLMQQLFEIVGQLMRAEGADIAQPRPVMRQLDAVQFLVERRVLDAVDFETEEQQLGRDRVDALVDVLIEAPALGVAHVGGVVERGVTHRAAERVLQLLIGGDRRGKLVARQRRELTAIMVAETFGRGRGTIEIGLEFGRFRPGIEIAEIPFRQRAQILRFRCIRWRHDVPLLAPIDRALAGTVPAIQAAATAGRTEKVSPVGLPAKSHQRPAR